MNACEINPLNTIGDTGKDSVDVINIGTGMRYRFSASIDVSEVVTFACQLYQTAAADSAVGQVQTHTLGYDGFGNFRSEATGASLDELVFNLDWPHRPSELAMLRLRLAECEFTNVNRRLVDKVFVQVEPERQALKRSEARKKAEPSLNQQASCLQVMAQDAIAEAQAKAAMASRYGVLMPVEMPKF